MPADLASSAGRRVMGQFGIGQAVKRFEDPRLLRGEGGFTTT